MLDNTIAALVTYAEQNGLITEDDRVYSVNALLERLVWTAARPRRPSSSGPSTSCWTP